jgi:hypothetical protein
VKALRLASVTAVLAAHIVLAAPFADAVQGGTLDGGPRFMWQTNGTVFALAVVDGVLYAGGDFTSVRPPGSPPGTNEVPREHLAAFTEGGKLLPFHPGLDGRVSSLAGSADGSRLYAGGQFQHVGNVYRNHVAAFDTATGLLVSSWRPSVNGPVTALATRGAAVYLGGNFTSVSGASRSRLAKVDAAGSLLPWTPTADGPIYAIAVSKTQDGWRILVGGNFFHLDGRSQAKIGSVGPILGALKRWDFQPVPTTGKVKTIVVDAAGNAYAGVESTGTYLFEGTFSAEAATGAERWLDDCKGATQSIVLVRNFLYVGSHMHGCSGVEGGPVETNPRTWHHLVAEDPASGAIEHFFPNTNGNPLGPRALATDGTQLFVGGDFGRVNNQPRQGLARFGPPPPDTTPPGRPAEPSATSPSKGTVRVTGATVNDFDDGALTYDLFRDCVGARVDRVVVTSVPWSHPAYTLEDTGLTSGSHHSYCVTVSDGTSVRRSPPVTLTVR